MCSDVVGELGSVCVLFSTRCLMSPPHPPAAKGFTFLL
jgi:hypothetical protein